MSGQAQEVYSTLLQIDKLLADIELKISKLEGTKGASSTGIASVKKELHDVNMYLIAMERWSGSDTLAGIVNRIQSLTQFAMRLQRLLQIVIALETVANAGLGPAGWLNLGAQAIGATISAQNVTYTWSQ